VRDIAEQRTQRDHQLHAERFGEVDQMRAEGAPAHRGLDALDEHEISRSSGRGRLEDLHRRPHDLTLVGIVELNARAVGLKVVELLGVDPCKAPRLKRRGQEGDRARGRIAGVVPALECAHHRRGA
jgi:hypothetical protein